MLGSWSTFLQNTIPLPINVMRLKIVASQSSDFFLCLAGLALSISTSLQHYGNTFKIGKIALMGGLCSVFSRSTLHWRQYLIKRCKLNEIIVHFRFDRDRSGTIDANELNTAFNSFGYRL